MLLDNINISVMVLDFKLTNEVRVMNPTTITLAKFIPSIVIGRVITSNFHQIQSELNPLEKLTLPINTEVAIGLAGGTASILMMSSVPGFVAATAVNVAIVYAYNQAYDNSIQSLMENSVSVTAIKTASQIDFLVNNQLTNYIGHSAFDIKINETYPAPITNFIKKELKVKGISFDKISTLADKQEVALSVSDIIVVAHTIFEFKQNSHKQALQAKEDDISELQSKVDSQSSKVEELASNRYSKMLEKGRKLANQEDTITETYKKGLQAVKERINTSEIQLAHRDEDVANFKQYIGEMQAQFNEQLKALQTSLEKTFDPASTSAASTIDAVKDALEHTSKAIDAVDA